MRRQIPIILFLAGISLLLWGSNPNTSPKPGGPDYAQIPDSVTRPSFGPDIPNPTPPVFLLEFPEPTSTPVVPTPKSEYVAAATYDRGQVGVTLDKSALEALAREAGFEGDTLISWVTTIATCESGGRTFAVGGGDLWFGVMQMALEHFPKAANAGYITQEQVSMVMDPYVNMRVAKWLYDARGGKFGGRGGWSCADRNDIP